MAFNSLYRRFRPETFSEVIGQDHIVRTLVNQIKSNMVGHAYLFTGTRGTGKTSVAKIFSKAVNCENRIDGSPCGKCATCMELKLSSNFDVLELDAASNNSVEVIRELVDKINFPPTIGRFKVYIIDEVHMLSRAAFNALLKTLEEPPQHAIFILATTEVQSIPATIMSRCLRFDFRLVPNPLISKHLGEVFKKVGANFQDEALDLIATAATGSVRDALSIADMCLSFGNGMITYEGVLEVLGASDPRKILKLTAEIADGNTDAVFKSVGELCDLGKSVRVLSQDLAEVFRNILFIKNCSNAKEILSIPDDLFSYMSEISLMATNDQLLFAVSELNSLEASYRTSFQHRIIFEGAVIKITLNFANKIAAVDKLKELEGRISRLEKVSDKDIQKKNIVFENAAQRDSVQTIATASKDTAIDNIVEQKNTYGAKQLWNLVIEGLNLESDDASDKILLLAATEGQPEILGNELVVYFPNSATVNLISQKDNREKLVSLLKKISDFSLRFETKAKAGGNSQEYIKKMFGGDLIIK